MAVGLEQGFYSVNEDSGIVQVCTEVKAGDIAGRSISVQYATLDGSANGIYYICINMYQRGRICMDETDMSHNILF